MKLLPFCSFMLVAIAVPLKASANDFPTTARVEYVMECMKNHNSKYEYMYKCSCAIDDMAQHMSFDEFAEISTAARNKSMGGQRGAEFRDPANIKDMVKHYSAVEASANDACFIK